MKKTYDLPESSIAIIHKVKREKGYNSEIQALIHIIETYQNACEKEQTEKDIYAQLNKELRLIFASLVAGNRKIEKNTNVLLDFLNSYTILKLDEQLQCIPSTVTKSEFIQKSEGAYKARIAEQSRKKKNADVKKVT